MVASCLTLSWRRCSNGNAVTFGEACFGRFKVGVWRFFPVYTGSNWKLASFASVGGQWKQFV